MCSVNVAAPHFHAELAAVAQTQASIRALRVLSVLNAAGKDAYTKCLGWFGLPREILENLQCFCENES